MSLSDLRVTDKNETLKPPKGFTFAGTRGEGPLIVLDYVLQHPSYSPDHADYVSIYLNDQGREVLRTFRTVTAKDPEFDIDWSGGQPLATDAVIGKPPTSWFWEGIKSLLQRRKS